MNWVGGETLFSPSFKSERILARGTFEVKYFTFSAFKTDLNTFGRDLKLNLNSFTTFLQEIV
jgi:hypothetical protein